MSVYCSKGQPTFLGHDNISLLWENRILSIGQLRTPFFLFGGLYFVNFNCLTLEGNQPLLEKFHRQV